MSASIDPLFGVAGVPRYVQEVLVPQIVLGVESQEARRIMTESDELGELLNEEDA